MANNSFYFPGVDKIFLTQRDGTVDNPYLPLSQTSTVKYGKVELAEIPNFQQKVTVTNDEHVSLTEVTTLEIGENEFRVDYSTGVVKFNSIQEGNSFSFNFLGMGRVNFPASRITIDTVDNNEAELSIQQLLDSQGNIGDRLTQAQTEIQNLESSIEQNQLVKSDDFVNYKEITDYDLTEKSNQIGNLSTTVGDATIFRNFDSNMVLKMKNEFSERGINAKWNGILPSNSDNSSLLQSLIDYCKTNKIKMRIRFPSGRYYFKSGITLYSDLVTLIAEGEVIFDFGQVTSGVAVYITGTTNEISKAYAQRMIGIRVVGNYVTGVTGIKIDTPTVGFNSFQFDFGEGSIEGFMRGLEFGSNTWVNTIKKVRIESTKGTCVYMPASVINAGERLTFDDCNFHNSKEAICIETGTASVYVKNSSIDYCSRLITAKGGASIYVTDSHLETGQGMQDKDYLFYIEGDGSSISIVNSHLLFFGAYSNYPIGKVNQESGKETNFGGLFISQCKLKVQYDLYVRTTLIEGDGRALAERLFGDYNSLRVPFSRYQNLLAYGNFYQDGDLNEWQTRGTKPTIDQTVGKRGTSSAHFNVSYSGDRRRMHTILNYHFGSKVAISFYLKTSGMATNNSLNLIFKYLDKNGTVIGTALSTGFNTGVESDWKPVFYQPNLPATSGVTQIEIELDTGGWETSSNAWVDDFVVNLL